MSFTEEDYTEQPRDSNSYPNVPLRASVSAAGDRITIVLPDEFIHSNVAVLADPYGRHRVQFDPVYGGQNVIGFVDPSGVKYGKIEINPAPLGLKNLVPSKVGQWYAKQRDHDLLIGRLLTGLCQPDFAAVTEPKIKEVEIVKEITVEKPWTIEGAIQFLNQWADENKAELIVEENTLYVEVKRRLGGKKAA